MSVITHYSENIKMYPGVCLPDLDPICYTEMLKQAHFCHEKYGWLMVVHCGVATTGHSGKTHAEKIAIDLHFEKDGVVVSLFDQFIASIRFDWNGRGIYPYWNSPGLHLDMRREGQFDEAALWWRDKDLKYLPVETQYFKEMFL